MTRIAPRLLIDQSGFRSLPQHDDSGFEAAFRVGDGDFDFATAGGGAPWLVLHEHAADSRATGWDIAGETGENRECARNGSVSFRGFAFSCDWCHFDWQGGDESELAIQGELGGQFGGGGLWVLIVEPRAVNHDGGFAVVALVERTARGGCAGGSGPASGAVGDGHARQAVWVTTWIGVPL